MGRRARHAGIAGVTAAVAALAVIVLAGGATAALSGATARSAAAVPPAHIVEIKVLSTRADLVSGGDALVQVLLPADAQPSAVRVDVDGRDVTGEFAQRSNGKFEGLLYGPRQRPERA